MIVNPYLLQYEQKEYERRVRAFLLERALHKARAERANAVAHLAGQCRRVATGLAGRAWCWVKSALHVAQRPLDRA